MTSGTYCALKFHYLVICFRINKKQKKKGKLDVPCILLIYYYSKTNFLINIHISILLKKIKCIILVFYIYIFLFLNVFKMKVQIV